MIVAVFPEVLNGAPRTRKRQETQWVAVAGHASVPHDGPSSRYLEWTDGSKGESSTLDISIYFTTQLAPSLLAIVHAGLDVTIQISGARSIGLANGVLRRRVDVFQGSHLATIPGLGVRDVIYREAIPLDDLGITEPLNIVNTAYLCSDPWHLQ